MFLAYASARGRALIDRELYLPEHTWCADRERCRQAAVPDEVAFATKPKLAQQMIGRALEAGVPFAWVAADEVYGQHHGLRSWPEGRAISYGMAAITRGDALSSYADEASVASGRWSLPGAPARLLEVDRQDCDRGSLRGRGRPGAD